MSKHYWDHKRITGTRLLNYGYNHKTVKGDDKGEYFTGILYLAPAKQSGFEVCPARTPHCTASCLAGSGFGARPVVKTKRIRATQLLFSNQTTFLADVCHDIEIGLRYTKKHKMGLAIRLNGTSDVNFIKRRVQKDGMKFENIMDVYPEVMFYDYTKRWDMMWDHLNDKHPKNYHLTFSVAEHNHAKAKQVLVLGGNVAVVFEDKLPETFWGYPVVDGDEDDLRFMNRRSTVIGLKYKKVKDEGGGRINKMDKTGFVFNNELEVK